MKRHYGTDASGYGVEATLERQGAPKISWYVAGTDPRASRLGRMPRSVTREARGTFDGERQTHPEPKCGAMPVGARQRPFPSAWDVMLLLCILDTKLDVTFALEYGPKVVLEMNPS